VGVGASVREQNRRKTDEKEGEGKTKEKNDL
jgi:hypothetical protein